MLFSIITNQSLTLIATKKFEEGNCLLQDKLSAGSETRSTQGDSNTNTPAKRNSTSNALWELGQKGSHTCQRALSNEINLICHVIQMFDVSNFETHVSQDVVSQISIL